MLQEGLQLLLLPLCMYLKQIIPNNLLLKLNLCFKISKQNGATSDPFSLLLPLKLVIKFPKKDGNYIVLWMVVLELFKIVFVMAYA